jgi:uncharacterized protein
MSRSRLEIAPGFWADARRALWIEEYGWLAVADLHLGYAWAHRAAGQMLPVSASLESIHRLLELQREYRPKTIAILGDIVHRALPLDVVRNELDLLLGQLSAASELCLIGGNHDFGLADLLASGKYPAQLREHARIGPHLLLHGDQPDAAAAGPLSEAARARKGRILMGHEHPALSLGDGVTSMVRCPCFLISDCVLVLPAFSTWASGCVIGREPFLSPLARHSRFEQAAVLMGQRILAMPLGHAI